MYYHGTGSENAGRAYTEAPMQHVQRNALRKKCMKSTFTLLETHTEISLSSSVYLSHAHAHTCSRTFFRHHRSFSFSLPFSFFFSLYLKQKSHLRELSKYNHSSRILLKSSRLVFIAFRTFLPSSVAYGKCILIPKCISMHRVLL